MRNNNKEIFNYILTIYRKAMSCQTVGSAMKYILCLTQGEGGPLFP